MKILIINTDVIGERMAGPAIRWTELAKRLSKQHTVRLMGTIRNPRSSGPYELVDVSVISGLMGIAWADAIIYSNGNKSLLLLASFWPKKLKIADLYIPAWFEDELKQCAQLKDKMVRWLWRTFYTPAKLFLFIRFFDKFLIATNRQSDALTGMMALCGQQRQSGNVLKVPFGCDLESFESPNKSLKGVWPGIAHDDFVLIWGGGVWDWLDCATLVKAMKLLSRDYPKVKAFFMGVRSPLGYLPKNATILKDLSEECGLLGETIFINEGWIPYNDRGCYLCDADVGIGLHYRTMETRFSYRTRNLDYIAARLPIIQTEGDEWADIIANHKIGLVVRTEDHHDLAEKILSLYNNRDTLEDMKRRIGQICTGFGWDAVSRPLEEALSRVPGIYKASELISRRETSV